jgi:hypothetical protein
MAMNANVTKPLQFLFIFWFAPLSTRAEEWATSNVGDSKK